MSERVGLSQRIESGLIEKKLKRKDGVWLEHPGTGYPISAADSYFRKDRPLFGSYKIIIKYGFGHGESDFGTINELTLKVPPKAFGTTKGLIKCIEEASGYKVN